MVKIKDFTLASKKSGRGARSLPCPTHLPPMIVYALYEFYRKILRTQNAVLFDIETLVLTS